jgi:Tol biopolymer transport system component
MTVRGTTIALAIAASVFQGTSSAQVTTRASLSATNLELPQSSGAAAISGNGKFVAFVTNSALAVTPDNNGADDVFLRDIVTGKTERISKGLHVAESNGASNDPSVSRTGRYVVYSSVATNMADEDTNNLRDIFRVDRETGIPLMVSKNAAGIPGNGASSDPSVSADGRFVAFVSTATNLSPDDTDSIADVFIKDKETGIVHLASRKSPKAQGVPHGPSRLPQMHADGSGCVFESDAADLVGNDTNNTADVFQFDRILLEVRAISVDLSNKVWPAGGRSPSTSETGRHTAYTTNQKVAANDTNTSADVYVRDRLSGVTQLASFSDFSGATVQGAVASNPSISTNGRYVAFTSTTVLSPLDVNSFRDVYSRDLETGALYLLSDVPGALGSNNNSDRAALNDTGCRAAFTSNASNLVAGDGNQVADVFHHEGSPPTAAAAADLAVVPYPTIFAIYKIGGPAVAPIPVTISNLSADCTSNLGFAISVTPAVNWLSFDTTYGLVSVDEGEETVQLLLDPSGLPAGIHEATLRFQNVVEPSDFADVVVALRVMAGTPDLCVSGPANVVINHTLGGPAPSAFAHVVSNCGGPGSLLDWTVTATSPTPWLVIDELGGTLAAAGTQVVNVVPNPTGLGVGSYQTKLVYRNAANGADQFICDVTLNIGQLVPDLALDSLAPIVVDHTVGGPNVYLFERKVKNVGSPGSVLAFSATPSSAVSWLKISPTFGNVATGADQPLGLRVMPSGLGAGLHKVFVDVVNTQNPADKETIGITVKVGFPPATMCVTPIAPITKTFAIGGPAPTGSLLQVTNCGIPGSLLDWTVDTDPGVNWVITLPSPEQLGVGQAQNILVVYNVAGLAPGQYATNLRFRNLANPVNQVLVPVQLTVSEPTANLCLDSALPILGTFTQGGAQPSSVVRTVTNCGDSLSTLDFTVVSVPPVPWLLVHDPIGSLGAGGSKAFTFQFKTTGLAAGDYETKVHFVNVADPTDLVIVDARLTIDQPASDLAVTPSTPASAVYAIGGPNPSPVLFSVSNLGAPAAKLDWYVETAPQVPWLAFTPKNGQTGGGQSKTVQAAINPTGLAPGVHAATVRFVNLANPQDFVAVPFVLNVIEPAADLSIVGATEFQLAYTLGGPAPAPVAITVRNIGHPLSTLPVAAFTVPGSPWLAASPPTFELAGQGPNQQLVVSGVIDPLALTAGVKQSTLRFVNAENPSDFAEVKVTVTVTAPLADLCIDTSLPIALTWTQGDPALATQQRTITNCGAAFSTLQWTATTSPAAPYVVVTPKSGSLAASGSSLVDIVLNPAGLAPGVHATNLVFTNNADPNDFATVPVSLTVLEALPDLTLNAAPIVTNWTKGTPNPADVAFTVNNAGHPSSQLGWVAEMAPLVPWLAVLPGAGAIDGAGSQGGTLHFQLDDAIPEGLASTVVTIRSLSDPSDFATISVAVGVIEPAADLDVVGAPIAVNYEIGFDLPVGASFGVSNVGPAGSSLDWNVSVLPNAPWLEVTSFGGALASGVSTNVGVGFDVSGLEEGTYQAILRFANLDNALDFFEFPIELVVEEPDADLCIADGVTALPLSMVVGQTAPTATFAIENCGDEHADLDYAIEVMPPVAWLELSAIAGVLPFDQVNAPIQVSLVATDLIDGVYQTTLHVFNTADPSDFVDLPVTLTVGNMIFLPGDRILGGFDVFDASHELEFDAIKNEVVKFKVSSPTKGKLQISVIDSIGKVVKSVVVKTGPKALKKAIKIKATGHYRLRLEPAKGSLAPFDAKTSRKIPKTSLKAKKKGGPGSTGALELAIEMLPGGTMTATAKKANSAFQNPLSLTLVNALGSPFDLTPYVVQDGTTSKTSAIPCNSLGLWKFLVTGFDSKKAKAKINVKATQPKGVATITLPNAPTVGP